MIRTLVGDLPVAYLALRVGNVAVRPVSLFVFAALVDDLSVSVIALCYTFGAWLMAPMSCGSYRWLLPIERRFGPGSLMRRRAEAVYSGIIAISIVMTVPVVYWLSADLMSSAFAGALAAQIVIYDFLTHEQSRRILYGGQLTKWAAFLLRRNLLPPIAWMLAYGAVSIVRPDTAVQAFVPAAAAATVPVLGLAVLVFARKHLVFGTGAGTSKCIRAIAARVRGYWQYAAVGIMTKSHQQVDKILTAVILPEYVWIVAIVNYLASVPVTAFEMINLARLKSKVLGLRSEEIAGRIAATRKDVSTFLVFGIPSGIIAAVFLQSQGLTWQAPAIAAVYLVFSWFFMISLKRTELLFWTAKNKWIPFRIDAWAGAANLLLAAALPFFGKSLLLVKLPAVVGAVVKDTWTRRTLERSANG